MSLVFPSLGRAAVKFTSSILRRAGAGSVHPNWVARAEVCERCPLRVVAGNVSYCGQPFFRKPNRDEAEDGCGCPTRDKARDPDEHCPMTSRNQQSSPPGKRAGPCDCKWCATNLPAPVSGLV
jgi:hypothetical protein